MGKETGIVHQTTHFRDLQRQHAAYGNSYKGINPTDGNFHVYGFLWEKTGVTWFVDGVPCLWQVNRIDIPMYVLIDLVVGKDPGNLWPGDPDKNNTWPAVMELDYYRVYSNDPSLPSVTPDPGYAPSVLPYGFQVETTSTTASLPPGWTAGDLVKLDVQGSTSWNKDSGEWLLKGSGYGNQGQFASAAHTGNGVINATVTSATVINSNDLKAGVTFRDGNQANSADVTLVYKVSYESPKVSHMVVLQAGGKEIAKVENVDPPVTMRLTRNENSFSGSYSPDGGRTWLAVGEPHIVVMPETLQAGLIIGGNQSNYHRLSRAYLRDVSVSKLTP